MGQAITVLKVQLCLSNVKQEKFVVLLGYQHQIKIVKKDIFV